MAVLAVGVTGEALAQPSTEEQATAEMRKEVQALREQIQSLQRGGTAPAAARQQAKEQASAEVLRELRALREQIDNLENSVTAEAAKEQTPEEQSAAQLQQHMRELDERLETLQHRLDEQIEATQQLKAAAEAAAAQAAAAKAETAAIPAKVQSAVESAKPKNDKISYKGVTITLGGFVAAEVVHRSIDTGNDIATGYNGSYYANDPFAHSAQTLFSARQSTLSGLVQADASADTHLGLFGQMDFQGAAQTATPTQSNSFNPRLMQLYGTIDWDGLHLHLLGGQAWSLVTLNRTGITPLDEVIPPTIDAQYLPGFTWARQPQIRLTQDIDGQLWIALSLENPQTTFYTGANALPTTVNVDFEQRGTGLGFSTENTLSANHIPDVILKFAGDPTWRRWSAHLEAYGIYRSFYERLNERGKSISGGGFGAGLVAPLIPRWLDLEVSGLAGKGLGRYGSAQLADVTFDPQGVLQPIRELMAVAGLTVHPLRTLDLYLFAGQEKASRQSYDLTTDPGPPPVIVGYGYGNPLYSNSGCASTAAAGVCIANERLAEQATGGFWYKPYTGSFGTVRVGAQFSRTEIKAFSGVGGAPTATFNTIFASFRYYPFD